MEGTGGEESSLAGLELMRVVEKPKSLVGLVMAGRSCWGSAVRMITRIWWYQSRIIHVLVNRYCFQGSSSMNIMVKRTKS